MERQCGPRYYLFKLKSSSDGHQAMADCRKIRQIGQVSERQIWHKLFLGLMSAHLLIDKSIYHPYICHS